MCCKKNSRYFKALLDNNHEVLEEIYNDIFPLLRKYVINNCGSDDEAWDLFQESIIVMLKLARKGITLKVDFKFYFLGICRNKWIDIIKKNKKFSYWDELNNLDINRSIIQQNLENQNLQTRSRYNQVLRAYSQLPEKCQKILKNLFSSEEMIPNKKIAEDLKMEYGYFRKKKCNCKKLLIQLFDESLREKELNEEL